MSAAVAFDNVVKAFGPVQVLHGVSFDLAPGRVIGLLGENGAGKSTLMKILAGYESLSGGELRIDGTAVHFDGPRAAEAQGIVMIHQEFALAEDLTIAQNIFLGHEKTRGWWLDDTAMRSETERVLAQVGLKASPDTPVKRLIGHPEAFIEAFANLYVGIAADIRSRLDLGQPASQEDADYPRIEDGARGVRFIEKTVESAACAQKWTSMR